VHRYVRNGQVAGQSLSSGENGGNVYMRGHKVVINGWDVDKVVETVILLKWVVFAVSLLSVILLVNVVRLSKKTKSRKSAQQPPSSLFLRTVSLVRRPRTPPPGYDKISLSV